MINFYTTQTPHTSTCGKGDTIDVANNGLGIALYQAQKQAIRGVGNTSFNLARVPFAQAVGLASSAGEATSARVSLGVEAIGSAIARGQGPVALYAQVARMQ